METQSNPGKSALGIETKARQIVIPDFEIDTLARCLLPQIQAYFASPEGQAAFEKWQKQQNR